MFRDRSTTSNLLQACQFNIILWCPARVVLIGVSQPKRACHLNDLQYICSGVQHGDCFKRKRAHGSAAKLQQTRYSSQRKKYVPTATACGELQHGQWRFSNHDLRTQVLRHMLLKHRRTLQLQTKLAAGRLPVGSTVAFSHFQTSETS